VPREKYRHLTVELVESRKLLAVTITGTVRVPSIDDSSEIVVPLAKVTVSVPIATGTGRKVLYGSTDTNGCYSIFDGSTTVTTGPGEVRIETGLAGLSYSVCDTNSTLYGATKGFRVMAGTNNYQQDVVPGGDHLRPF
jgi:hypothetical protein